MTADSKDDTEPSSPLRSSGTVSMEADNDSVHPPLQRGPSRPPKRRGPNDLLRRTSSNGPLHVAPNHTTLGSDQICTSARIPPPSEPSTESSEPVQQLCAQDDGSRESSSSLVASSTENRPCPQDIRPAAAASESKNPIACPTDDTVCASTAYLSTYLRATLRPLSPPDPGEAASSSNALDLSPLPWQGADYVPSNGSPTAPTDASENAEPAVDLDDVDEAKEQEQEEGSPSSSLPDTKLVSPGSRRVREEADQDVCVVCMDRPRQAGFVHGKTMHHVACHECARIIAAMPNPRCPMCNDPILTVVHNIF
mmetsp:Transcript_37533/g.71932  ORF Transcript_37533/g.71932 Transcript_37533/m.71932 type:complete len:310 (-) Transcript_37533:205-1134(-)